MAKALKVLQPDTQEHRKLLQYLNNKIASSESAVSENFEKWTRLEEKHRAYIDLSEKDAAERERLFEDRSYGGPVPIVIPHIHAQHMTALSFLHATFARRVPKFMVESRHPDKFLEARMLESLLEYQCIRTAMSSKLYFFLNSLLLYGVGAFSVGWREDYRLQRVTRTRPTEVAGFLVPTAIESTEEEEEIKTFEGNQVTQIDPFYFFPDPNVPISCIQDGEFVAQRFFRSLIQLRRDSNYNNTDLVKDYTNKAKGGHLGYGFTINTNVNLRRADSRGIMQTSINDRNVMIDEISIDIVPNEVGLGTSKEVERWLFSIANRCLIVRAEPQKFYHGEFPFVAAELNPDGFSFMQGNSFTELLEPLQDITSWYLNAHIDNVRMSLNNIIVFNPMVINESDMEDLRYGGRIRANAIGDQLRNAIFQLPVADVTRGHMEDMGILFDIMKRVGHTPDNFMGHLGSGRRSAREVTGTFAQTGGIWQTTAELLSDVAMRPLAEQMISNTQQYMEEDAIVRLVGEQAREILSKSNNGVIRVSPTDIRGEFMYQAGDGTYPFDKAFIAQSLREFLSVSAQIDPALYGDEMPNLAMAAKEYFKALGFRSIDSFMIKRGVAPTVMDQGTIEEEERKGNIVPADQVDLRSAFAVEENDRAALTA